MTAKAHRLFLSAFLPMMSLAPRPDDRPGSQPCRRRPGRRPDPGRRRSANHRSSRFGQLSISPQSPHMPEATDLILLSPSSHKMQFSAICHLLFIYFFTVHLVQAERLGLSRIAPLAPKASAYASSATPACPAFMADSYSFLLILSDLSIKKRGGCC